MLSFAPLADLLKKKQINKSVLKTKKILNGGTYTQVVKAIDSPINNGLSISTIDVLCKFLNCQPSDIMEYIPDEQTNNL